MTAFQCVPCGYTSPHLATIQRHMDEQHEGGIVQSGGTVNLHEAFAPYEDARLARAARVTERTAQALARSAVGERAAVERHLHRAGVQ